MGDGVNAVSEMRYQTATKVRSRFYEAAHEAEFSLLVSFGSGRAVRKNGRKNLLLGYARYERAVAWLVVERIHERAYHGVAPGLVVTVTNLVKSEEQVHEVTGNPELIIVGIRVHVGCEQAPVRHDEVCTPGVRFREDAVAIHPSCRFSRSAIEVRISAAGERARGDEVWKVQVSKCHDCVLWCSVVYSHHIDIYTTCTSDPKKKLITSSERIPRYNPAASYAVYTKSESLIFRSDIFILVSNSI